MRWIGSAWTQLPSPNLGNGDNLLIDVDARPSGEVWAVGYYMDASIRHTMVQRWDGITWDVVPSADFGSGFNTLYGVDVISANDIWAVGNYSNAQVDSRTLAEHWDGTSWTVVPSPNVVTGTNTLISVDAVSANSIWAAGAYVDNMDDAHALTMHWDGSSWTVISTPSPGPGQTMLYYNSLAAVSESEVWASGFYNDTSGPQQAMVLRWNGTVWSLQTTVNPGTDGTTTIGIEAVSSLNVWVGGAYSDNSTHSYSLIERYSDPCITPTPTPTACPVQFTDVPLGSTFYDYVRCLACRNIVSGYTTSPPCTTGTPCFMPGNDVTRGQMAKFVSNSANFTDNIPPSQQTFTDVPYGSTFWLFVERAALHNVINGYTTSPPCTTGTPCFMPGAKVNRQQTAKFVSQAANYQDPIPPGQQTFTDVPPMTTFWTYIERVAVHGVVSGYTDPTRCPTGVPCFRPADNVTRGQTAKFISNAFFPNCQTPAK
jgi:hypothetical protein